MRSLILAVAFTGALLALPTSPAVADISTTQTLPTAACTNMGTGNAHDHIPPVPGNGMNPNLSRFGGQTNAHNAVPGTANIRAPGCGHGG